MQRVNGKMKCIIGQNIPASVALNHVGAGLMELGK